MDAATCIKEKGFRTDEIAYTPETVLNSVLCEVSEHFISVKITIQFTTAM